MPRDESASIVRPHNVIHRGETPRTKFVDWLDGIEVELRHGPDTKRVLRGILEMKEASYSPDWDLMMQRADQAEADGDTGVLHLGMEVPSFLFVIRGVSRIMTHQMVRQRIGITYAQKCTGDGDIRHDDVLVPRSLNKWGEERNLEWYVDYNLRFKGWYAQEVDRGQLSWHSLRYAMPHGLSQYIYMNATLMTLKDIYGKRMCPEQPIEWQTICRKMKQAMIDAGYEVFARVLKSNCETKSCHWHRRGNNDPLIGRIYWPDADHDAEPWNPLSFIHQGTSTEVQGGPPFMTREYLGRERVR